MRHPGRLTRDDAVVHQAHPAKLCTDIAAAAASTGLLWRRRLLAGLLIRYLPPMVASGLVLAFADLDRLRQTAGGRYVLGHMPDGAVGMRFAGDTLMAAAGWRRSVPGIALGAALIPAGWSNGLLPQHRTAHSAAPPLTNAGGPYPRLTADLAPPDPQVLSHLP